MDTIDTDIHGGFDTRRRERALVALAASQHGVVARRQLLQIGFGRGAIDHRVGIGRLNVVHRGVYTAGHPVLGPLGHAMAAVLAIGADAVLSHRSAAALWDLRPSARTALEVTVPRRGGHQRPGIALHRSRLHPDDRTTVRGIALTSVARTLLDLAEVVQRRQLERAFEEAERLRLLDLRALEALVQRSHGRRGLKMLIPLVYEARPPAHPVRSDLEQRFVELCRDHGLPPPRMNVLIAGLEVDAAWPARGLVVELDGHAYHRTRAAFERDRRRDTILALARQRVVRLTHHRLETDPAGVVEDLQGLLGSPAAAADPQRAQGVPARPGGQ